MDHRNLGGVDMAVTWMGLDFMVGGVEWHMMQCSAWPVAVKFEWPGIGAISV